MDAALGISTHTPLAGRDDLVALLIRQHLRFLLTRPLRDVTLHFFYDFFIWYISTHTPLAGRDPPNWIAV